MMISVDAMGGDYAPSVVVRGVVDALMKYSDIRVTLIGNKDIVMRELGSIGAKSHPRLSVMHADEVILMDDVPSEIVRGKRRSSMHLGLKLVKEGKADAFFSAGNSGAIMAVAMVTLGMLEGISRPAIGSVLPASGSREKFFMLDIGANVDCKPEHLVTFAIMGSAYANRVLNISNPSVGLLSNGEEEGKGDALTKNAFPLLRDLKCINFVGNIEAKILYKGEADVVISDGYVGNITIKVTQSVVAMIFKSLKEEIGKSFRAKIGALLLKDVFHNVKAKGDSSVYGGAPLLGVNGVCIIGHGGSNQIAITNGIRVAREAVLNKMNSAIIEGLKSL